MTTNQSPAEALDEAIQFLAKHIWEKAEFFASDEDEKRAEILYARKFMGQAVTAYAATVEREADTKARIDELWEILDYVTTTSYDTSTGQKMDKYINDRLAALQGPIQGDSNTSEEASSTQ
jgi:hypothetical protein